MKKKICTLIMAIAIAVSATACGGVSQSEYDEMSVALTKSQAENIQIQAENDSLVSQCQKAKDKLAEVQDDYAQLQASYDKLKDEYNSYKEQMKPFEELDEAERQARQIEADKAIAEAEAEAQRQAEEEEQARLEKEKKGYDTGITYNQLARTPDDYEGEKVKFTGKVIQVIEDDDEIDIRLAVNSDYDKVIYCGYDPSIVTSRILENDKITIYGTSVGLFSYESTFGSQVTIPAVWIDRIDQ